MSKLSQARRRAGAPSFAGFLCLLHLGGCAMVQELPDGSRRVTGLVSLTLPSSIEAERRGADAFALKTFGVSVVSLPGLTSFSIGYSADRFTAVRNDALVAIKEETSE